MYNLLLSCGNITETDSLKRCCTS